MWSAVVEVIIMVSLAESVVCSAVISVTVNLFVNSWAVDVVNSDVVLVSVVAVDVT